MITTASTEKLAQAVSGMRGSLPPTCLEMVTQASRAIRLAVDEFGSSPALDAVQKQADKVLAQVRALCCEYNNLRALMARLEREQGIESPRFWCGEINTTGEPTKCKQRRE